MFEISLIVSLLVIIFYLYGVIRELFKLQKILIELQLEVNKIEIDINGINRTVSDIDKYLKYGSSETYSFYEDGLKKLSRIEKDIKKSNE